MTEVKVILVVGATGNQGGAVVDALAADPQRWRIRALTRNAAAPKAKALAARGVELVVGDLSVRESLTAAVSGAYGVFSVQNSATAGLENEVEQGINVVDVAQAAGVKHLVYSSVSGADRNSGVSHFMTKWRVEQHIEKVGMPATVLRPASFMESFGLPGFQRAFALASFHSIVAQEKPLQMVALRDIGIFAKLALERPDRFVGSALDLAGDELTIQQMIDTIRRVTGKRVLVLPCPAALVRRMGGFGEMIDWVAGDGDQAPIDYLRTLHPGLLRFDEWLSRR